MSPAPFEVLVLGVGDTFSERHNTSALLLHHDGHYLAVDCPDRYRAVLADCARRSGRELELARIDRMLLTHVHGDHMNGLEGVAFFKHFVENQRLTLFTSAELRQVLWEQRLVATMGQLWDGSQYRSLSFEDYFAHTPLPWDQTTTTGPFEIRVRRTLHHVPTTALLIRCGGRTLGYSADTAFDPELIAWLSEADLIIHETNFGPAHTPYASLATLPAELRARMRLIHYPDSFNLAASNITPLVEGELLQI